MLRPEVRRHDPASQRRPVEAPEPAKDPVRHEGSVAHLPDWERWLELCARIDGFPRHLSIHSGGMLVTAAPLIDIAPIERATMPGRVVVQYDKRDVETMKLIKLDLLGLGMLAAIDETVQLIEHDCAVCLDLDRIPEEIPEVFDDAPGGGHRRRVPGGEPGPDADAAEVEAGRAWTTWSWRSRSSAPAPSRATPSTRTCAASRAWSRSTYLHPSLEPILHDTLGVILYQEQVMRIAIDVAGFTPAGSDAFRRAMGTYRSTREMEKLHAEFVDGCVRVQGMPRDDAEELFRRCAAFASFGFAKSHAAAFARTAYESSFLKLFYPAQFVVGLINAQPMGFYPVEVLVNDAKRHGVAVLPVDVNRSAWRTTTEWVGRPGWALAGAAGDDGSHDADAGEPLPEGCGIEARPAPVRSSACVIPGAAARERWAAESMTGWGDPAGAAPGQGDRRGAAGAPGRGARARAVRGPGGRGGADGPGRGGRGAADPGRGAGLAGPAAAGAAVAAARGGRGVEGARGRAGRRGARGIEAGRRPADGPAPARDGGAALPPITEPERLGDAYAVVGLDARRQAVAPVPGGAGPAGRGHERLARRAAAGPGADRRAGGHAPAPDDGARDGVPRPRGRDRDGQRHALAGHLGRGCGRWCGATRCCWWTGTSSGRATW